MFCVSCSCYCFFPSFLFQSFSLMIFKSYRYFDSCNFELTKEDPKVLSASVDHIIFDYIIYFCLLSYFMLMKDFRYFVLGSFVFRVSGLGLISYRRSDDGKGILSVKSAWSVLYSEITVRTLRTLEGMIKGTKQTQKSHKVRSILNNILAEKFPNICHWICMSVFLVRTRLNTSYSQKN